MSRAPTDSPGPPAAHGASVDTVRYALDTGDPLVGTRGGFEGCRGFAAVLDGEAGDGPLLVRDALGRYPVFSDRDAHGSWAFDPTDLSSPESVPPGTVRSLDGDWTDETVWTLPDGEPTVTEPTTAGNTLHRVLEDVFEAIRREDGETAVAFSGGVDSALVADALDGPCYVVGFPDSHDLQVARETAAEIGLDRFHVVEVTHDDIERAAPVVARATGRVNAMDTSIALSLYLVAERAAADGFDRLAVGQGADELFGGYQKVVDPASDHRVEAETVRGARRETMRSLPGGLERDVLALGAAGVDPVAPYLDDRVVAFALGLSDDCIVDGERRKVALREAARHRVPNTVAERDKKAVQYGSNVSRELDRLARRAGFKRRMDHHVRRYVESLL